MSAAQQDPMKKQMKKTNHPTPEQANAKLMAMRAQLEKHNEAICARLVSIQGEEKEILKQVLGGIVITQKWVNDLFNLTTLNEAGLRNLGELEEKVSHFSEVFEQMELT